MGAVDAIFPKVAPYLAKALGPHTAWTLPALWQECRTGNSALFVDSLEEPKNALICRFENWETPVLNLLIMAGEGGGEWPESVKYLRKFAANVGVTRIVAPWMRDGWKRHFPEAKRLYTVYEL